MPGIVGASRRGCASTPLQRENDIADIEEQHALHLRFRVVSKVSIPSADGSVAQTASPRLLFLGACICA